MTEHTFCVLFEHILRSKALNNKGKFTALDNLNYLRYSESKEKCFTTKDIETIGTYSTLINPIHLNSYEVK